MVDTTVPYARPMDIQRQWQSGFGVAAVALALPPLVAGLSLLLLLVWLDRNGGSAPPGYQGLGLLTSVLFYCSTMLIALLAVSVGLGVAGLVQRERKRHAAVAALCADVVGVSVWAAIFILSSR